MARIAYVNGRYLPHRAAAVHVEDRGYQFADGVYEVCEVREGRLVDERRHMQRLVRSLGELGIALPMSLAALGVVLRETVRRNRVEHGLAYLQVTRGVARRDFLFPAPETRPSRTRLRRTVSRSTTPSAARDIGGRIRNSESERASRSKCRRSSTSWPRRTSQTS